jgi:hypothetical protein
MSPQDDVGNLLAQRATDMKALALLFPKVDGVGATDPPLELKDGDLRFCTVREIEWMKLDTQRQSVRGQVIPLSLDGLAAAGLDSALVVTYVVRGHLISGGENVTGIAVVFKGAAAQVQPTFARPE